MENKVLNRGQAVTASNQLESELEALAAHIKQLGPVGTVDTWEAAAKSAGVFLTLFQTKSDDDLANRAWFIERVSHVRIEFIKAFEIMKAGLFYDAWCALERVEIDLADIFRNPFYDLNDFGIYELRDIVINWQRLFPYKVFFSPEMIIKKEICSLCGEDVHPWSTCTHQVGRVYGGRICCRIIKDLTLVSISMVLDPVQKYSVAFLKDDNGNTVDHYDYSVVAFLVERLASPFDRWSFEWTEAYHPHNLFPEVNKDAPCPCESGQVYESCCWSKRGVVRPHIQFALEKPPPENLPNAYLAGYKENNQAAILVRKQAECAAPLLAFGMG